jgi:pyruvate/2-oxoglutarate dehydrogenase complex dihydrolipoamide dehydrogenase (E3) component
MTPLTEANASLIANVHPLDWVNPEPATCYNLVVVGGGTAGLVTAAGAAALGAKVALVERHLLGGDCLNVGCVPSKALISAARAAYDLKHFDRFGMASSPPSDIDFGQVMTRLQRLRAQLSSHDSAHRFRDELGVDLFFGQGEFISADTLSVAGKELSFKRAAICTGTRPAVPPVPGLADTGYLTNETVFSITTLPKRLAIIGGGPIGCELAQAFSRFGSSITIIDIAPQLLGREDTDAAILIQQVLQRHGIRLALDTSIRSVSRRGDDRLMVLEKGGGSEEIVIDEILVAAGRKPNVEGLGLEKAGVKFDTRQGVVVNERLQTTNRRIYAAGDICSPYKFTHMADAQARIVVANALFMARQKTTSLVIPWCTYTDPEVAHVGLYENEARNQGIDVTTLTVPLADVDRAVLNGESEGFARVHLKRGSDTILGATIVARHAGEMINELSLAITAGLGLSSIGRTIHPYPTQAEAIRKLADLYNRSRLTPSISRILAGWFRWLRR